MMSFKVFPQFEDVAAKRLAIIATTNLYLQGLLLGAELLRK